MIELLSYQEKMDRQPRLIASFRRKMSKNNTKLFFGKVQTLNFKKNLAVRTYFEFVIGAKVMTAN